MRGDTRSGNIARETAARRSPQPPEVAGRPSADARPLNQSWQTLSTEGESARAGLQGPGAPLPQRAVLEAGFGVDLSSVRVHHGPLAEWAVLALGTKAYTVGQDIAFQSASPPLEIVAHEVAHTIQQRGGGTTVQHHGGSSAHEAEANEAAATVLAGGKAQVTGRVGTSVQRWGGSDHYAIGNLAGMKARQIVLRLGGTNAASSMTPTQSQASLDASRPGTGGSRGGGIVEGSGGTSVAVPTGAGTQISFGAAARLGGDYVKRPEEMAGRNAEVADGKYQLATDYSMMLWNAGTNANHFYPIAGSEWAQHHQQAVRLASDGRMTEALMQEGFASHFLADCFASGHVIPRALDSVDHLRGTVLQEDPTASFAAGKLGFAPLDPASSLYEDMKKGLLRSKNWHDFFCALPDGLPFTDGRHHGDNYMDGSDLDIVSTVCAESLAEVLAAGEGIGYVGAVSIPAPDLPGILGDPVAGPAWRLMMGDYAEDLARARREVKPTDVGVTDGGSIYSPTQVVEAIGRDVLDPGAAAGVGPASLRGHRRQVLGALLGLRHYLSAPWDYNIHLQQDDDLNLPSHPDEAHWDLQELERKFGLVSGLTAAARAYLEAVRREREASANPEWLSADLSAAQLVWELACSLLLNGRRSPLSSDLDAAIVEVRRAERSSYGETDATPPPGGPRWG